VVKIFVFGGTVDSYQRIKVMIYVFLGVTFCFWMYLESRGEEFTPLRTLTSPHYSAESRASEQETKAALEVCELLLASYSAFFGHASDPGSKGRSGPFRLRIFASRSEFRSSSTAPSWAEAYYAPPYCYQYLSQAANPWHWMVHEATHQLNRELSGFRLEQWLEEGIAAYFSTSRIIDGRMRPGDPDPDSYPIWWMKEMKLSGSPEKDQKSGVMIPLKSIVTGSGGPLMYTSFNDYYIHWVSLVHFLIHYDGGSFRDGLGKVIAQGGTPESFIENIGPFEKIEPLWYEHLRAMCRDAAMRSEGEASEAQGK